MRRELTVQEGVLSPGVKTVLGGDDSGVSRAERDESVSWSGSWLRWPDVGSHPELWPRLGC